MLPGLAAIYHSPLCVDTVRDNIVRELVSSGVLKDNEEPAKPRLYDAPRSIDMPKFQKVMAEKLDSYSALAAD
ncbi:hypothetical protein ES703_118628 [subsurface metagenome]